MSLSAQVHLPAQVVDSQIFSCLITENLFKVSETVKDQVTSQEVAGRHVKLNSVKDSPEHT